MKRTSHEIIQDAILFGTTRYEKGGIKLMEDIDIWCGIDPKIEKAKIKKQKGMDAVLSTIAFKAPTPSPSIWGTGYKNLMQSGLIERKRGHTKVSKTGKKRVKELETAVHRMFFTPLSEKEKKQLKRKK